MGTSEKWKVSSGCISSQLFLGRATASSSISELCCRAEIRAGLRSCGVALAGFYPLNSLPCEHRKAMTPERWRSFRQWFLLHFSLWFGAEGQLVGCFPTQWCSPHGHAIPNKIQLPGSAGVGDITRCWCCCADWEAEKLSDYTAIN